MRFLLVGLLFITIHPVQPQSKIKSYSLKKGIFLEVYIPDGYEKSLPVAYFNDGELVFRESGMNLKMILDSLIEKKFIDPIIAVAIHDNLERKSRFIPYNDSWIQSNMGNYKPKAEEYITRIKRYIIPFIESNYHVNDKNRALFGFSFGGLNALWAGMKTNQFQMVAGLSPSLWVSDYKLIQNHELNTQRTLEKVWFDIGTGEWNYYVPFIETLEDFGIKSDDIYYYEIPEAKHSPSAWRKRIGLPLKVFTQNQNDSVTQIELIKECIPSQSITGKIYQRLNVIATTLNGLRYSLNNKVSYDIIAGEGELAEDGGFLLKTSEMKVEVTFENITSMITLTSCN